VTVLRRRPLLRAAAELLNAANGVRPLGRRGYLTIGAFAFGWPTTELAPVLLGGSVLDAARRGVRGDFAGRRGTAALTLTAAAWIALAVIQRRNVASAPYFDAPLRDALGPDYAALAATSSRFCSSRVSGSRSGILTTSWSRRRYVEKAATVSYGPHGRANLLDVWRRSDLPRDGRAPVLVQIPGGAWALGWRRGQAYPLLDHLSARGWICVSMNYRVSPAHTWPDHIVDVKRVLAWVKENIAGYGGDPDFVAVTGGSAGGHLAALAALTPGDPRFQPGFTDADTSVVAAVPVYGRYDWFTEEGNGRPGFIAYLQKFVVKRKLAADPQPFLDASPIRHLTPDAPPFFVLHGHDDSIIPVGEARSFVEALRGVSEQAVAYAEIPYAQHAFDIFGSPRAHYSAAAIGRFLSWVHARHQQTRQC
jgi:acetyl esterase/lipase